MNTAREPIARGTLQATPFAHLLLSIKDKSLSGTLAIWPEDKSQSGQDRILFRSGDAVGGRFRTPAASFERGLIGLLQRWAGDYALYEEDLVSGRDDALHGRVRLTSLLMMGSRSGVRPEIQNKVLERIGNQRLRIRPGTTLGEFLFDPEETRFVNFMRAEPVDAHALVRDSGNPDVAKRVLYVLAITKSVEKINTPSRPAPVSHSGQTPVNVPFTDPPFVASKTPSTPAQTAPIAGKVASPAATTAPVTPAAGQQSDAPSSSAATSASRAPQKPKSTFRPGEVNAPRSMPPAVPANLRPELRAQWQEVSRYIAMMDKQTYFDMLGVKENASDDDISRRYLQLAKRWHPDRIAPELEPIRPWVSEIFHWLTTARDTLLDPQKKKKYLKSMASGSGTPEEERKVSAIVEAAMTFQKVQVLARQKKWEPALLMLDDCLQISPQDPDYHATRASILYQQHGIDNEDMLKQIELSLTNATNLNRNHVQAMLTKAQIYKRLGDEKMALSLFRKVVELEPKNIDAIREVRLANMRKERAGRWNIGSDNPKKTNRPSQGLQKPADNGGGLLGKIFSKFKK